MKCSNANHLAGFFVCVSMLLLASPAPGQRLRAEGGPPRSLRMNAKYKTPPVSKPLSPQLVKTNSRPAIPFKPFEMVDPVSGKPVPPNHIIQLPSGRKFTAEKYYAELNRHEQFYNSIGHSIRDPQDRVKVYEIPLDRTKLQAEAATIKAAHKRFNPATMRPLKTVKESKRDWVAARAAAIAKAAAPTRTGRKLIQPVRGAKSTAKGTLTDLLGRPLDTGGPYVSRPVRNTLGDPEKISAYLRGGIWLDGGKGFVTLRAEGHAGGSVLGHSGEILGVVGDVMAPISNPARMKLDVILANQNILAIDESRTWSYTVEEAPYTQDYVNLTPEEREQELGNTFDMFHREFPFQLGPVPMSCEVGAYGEAGVEYHITFQPVRLHAVVGPYVTANMYADVAFDPQIAEVGVGCNLTLVRDAVLFDGDAKVVLENDKYYLDQFYGCRNVMTMLAGYLYFYVEYWSPTLFNPNRMKRKEWEIYDWEGIVIGGEDSYLFSETRRNVVG